jgi:hypothetical protein
LFLWCLVLGAWCFRRSRSSSSPTKSNQFKPLLIF